MELSLLTTTNLNRHLGIITRASLKQSRSPFHSSRLLRAHADKLEKTTVQAEAAAASARTELEELEGLAAASLRHTKRLEGECAAARSALRKQDEHLVALQQVQGCSLLLVVCSHHYFHVSETLKKIDAARAYVSSGQYSL